MMNTRDKAPAQIEIIMGCMFSGKTSELLRRVKRHVSINRNVILVNHAMDIRYDNEAHVTSHDGIQIKNKPTVKSISVYNLKDVFDRTYYDSADIIAIDEAQFFGDLVDTVKIITEKHNKMVIICGLNGDAARNKFGSILDLIPFADNVIFLQALCCICNDGTKGIFSKKINTCAPVHKKDNITKQDKPPFEYIATLSSDSDEENTSDINTLIEVGKSDVYMAVCRKHYIMDN